MRRSTRNQGKSRLPIFIGVGIVVAIVLVIAVSQGAQPASQEVVKVIDNARFN